MMYARRFVLGEPVEVGDARVIPLVVTCRSMISDSHGAWVAVERTPVGIVLAGADSVRAFLVDGREQDPWELVQVFPELERMLGPRT